MALLLHSRISKVCLASPSIFGHLYDFFSVLSHQTKPEKFGFRRFDAKVAWMLLNMLRFKKCHLSFIFIAHMKPLLNILNFEPTNILSFWRLFWKNFTVLLLVFRAFQDFFNEPFEPFRVFRAFRGLLSLSSFSKLLRLFLDFENS